MSEYKRGWEQPNREPVTRPDHIVTDTPPERPAPTHTGSRYADKQTAHPRQPQRDVPSHTGSRYARPQQSAAPEQSEFVNARHPERPHYANVQQTQTQLPQMPLREQQPQRPYHPEVQERRPQSRRRRKKKRSLFLRILGWFFKILLFMICAVIIFGSVWGFTTFRKIVANAPDLDPMTLAPTEASTYIYNKEGKREQKLTLPESNRDLVTISDIPKDLQHAFVAIEDSRFYEHNGIDLQGIARAFVVGLKNGNFSEGASTITQQLLKNSVFTGWTEEKTFADRLNRKIQEQYLAVKLEKLLSKEQILQDYMNVINLGAGCIGVQSASYKYFGKPVNELTLSECAVIAGITQNPTRFNPITHPEDNAARRKKVLKNMLEQGYITQAAMDEALADPVYDRIQSNDTTTDNVVSIYSYYQDALIAQVIQDLQDEKGYTYKQAYKAVYAGGLRIYSAQDPQIQEICDNAFADTANFPAGTEVGIDYALSIEDPQGEITDYGNEDLKSYVRSTGDASFDLMYQTREQAQASADAFKASVLKDGDTILGERCTITPQPQASAVIIDQSTGLVKAIVGGRGTKEASLTLNRASYTQRQPGSTFKVLAAFAPALEVGGQTLATRYENEPFEYASGGKVNNWDLNSYGGTVSMRDAITQSINVAAVRCITDITPAVGYEFVEKFGISTLVDGYNNGTETLTDKIQPLALGGLTFGVTNLELCGAYAAIANKGRYIAPKFYTQVFDHYGNLVLDNSDPEYTQVISQQNAYLLTSAMQDVITSPNGTANGVIDLGGMAVAGKSGTTSSYKDIWFTGYTPYYTCSVWGGYDNNANLPNEGIYHTYNKVLWNAIMNGIDNGLGLSVSSFSHPDDVIGVQVCKTTGLVAGSGCDAYTEYFAKDALPATYCNVHGIGYPVDASDLAGSGIRPGSLQGSDLNQTTTGSALPSDAITIYSSDSYSSDPNVMVDGQTYGNEASGNAGQSNAPDNSASGEFSATPQPDNSSSGSSDQPSDSVITILNNIPEAH